MLAPATLARVPTLAHRSRQWLSALGRIAARLRRDVMLQKSVVSLLDQAVVSAMNFAVTIFLTRVTGRAEVGFYYLALQLVFFLRGVQEQLIAAPWLIYSGRRPPAELPRFAGSSLCHALLLLAATSLGITLAAATGLCSAELTGLLQWLTLAVPLLLLRELVRQYQFAELKVWGALVFDLAVVGCQTLGLAILAWSGTTTANLTFVVLACGCGLPTAVWFILRRGTFAPETHRVWPDWLINWKFSRWALATQLLGCSMPYLIPWVLAAEHGTAATASLGVGATLIGIANMFVLGVSNLVCPQAARAYASGGRKALLAVLGKAAGLYVLVLGSFTLFMIFEGEHCMTLLYGQAFTDSGSILAILACGALANSLGIVAGNGLWAMERPAANFRADLCAMFTWVVMTWLLAGPFGAWGAAVASTAGLIISALVRNYILYSELQHARA